MSRNSKKHHRDPNNSQAKFNKANSLSGLSKLIRESPVFRKDLDLEEDDEVIEAVWKLLSDKRERSVFEIITAIGPGATPIDVQVAVNVLRNEGKLTVRGIGGSFLYKIKPGVVSPAVQNLGPVKLPKVANTLPSRNSEYIINPDEGLDVCIWKLMSDLKSRRITEISDLLHEYGFSSVEARNRTIALAHRGWFNRSGQSKRTEYCLKKGFPMPAIVKPTVVKEEPKVNSTTTVRERPTLTLSKPVIPTVSASLPQPSAEVKMKPTNTPIVSKDDISEVAIWKVMSDQKGWTPAEVGLLLADFGFDPKTIATRMSYLFLRLKWFTRVEEGRSYRYTMFPGIPMPGKVAVTPPVETPAPVSAPQPQLFPEVTSNKPVVQKETAMSVTQIKPVQPVEVPKRSFRESSMLSFRATIKGSDFTFEQVQLLLEELVRNGYGKGKVSTEPAKFLTTHHKIRDKLFTDAELETLTLELLDAGFEVDEE